MSNVNRNYNEEKLTLAQHIKAIKYYIKIKKKVLLMNTIGQKAVSKYLSQDYRTLERLVGFIPENIFDMHAHIWRKEYIPGFCKENTFFYNEPQTYNIDRFFNDTKGLYPGARIIRANFLAFPDAAMKDDPDLKSAFNKFLSDELKNHSDNTGAVIVMPDMSKKDIERSVLSKNIKGMKCYHTASKRKDTFNANISEYLPEAAWQVAHENNLYITLHMVKEKALSDIDNLNYIIEHCKNYRSAKLILAHAARGFCYHNTLDGIKYISGLPNVYFDSSAICESESLVAILNEFGPERLLWGSDNPAGMMRGRCVTIGESFIWLYSDNNSLDPTLGNKAVLIAIESLLALKKACEYINISKEGIKDIFYNNALSVLNLS